ncbi:MAG: hypothetical protein ACP5QO_05630 [Clostridia bacterium]
MSLQHNTPPPNRRHAAAPGSQPTIPGSGPDRVHPDGQAAFPGARSLGPSAWESPLTQVHARPEGETRGFTWRLLLAGLGLLAGVGAAITASVFVIVLMYVGVEKQIAVWGAVLGAGILVTVGAVRWLARH